MAVIHYARTDEFWRRGEKYDFLDASRDVTGVDWRVIQPDANHTWLTEGMEAEFDTFLPIGTQEAKAGEGKVEVIFEKYSLGVSTNRDVWVYNFSPASLAHTVQKLIENYNSHVYRWDRQSSLSKIDNFIENDPTKISWSSTLKRRLSSRSLAQFDSTAIRPSLYRPFTTESLYFDPFLIDRPGLLQHFLPTPSASNENRLICVPTKGGRSNAWCYCTNRIPNLNLMSIDATQCFPFYTYAEDGSQRRENITDWALAQFRSHYADESIDKWAIFHYVYALLHHPAYREKYAANLRRSLPRLPFAPDFWSFAQAGARLAELHVHYEQQPEYPLEWVENRAAAMDFRVEKMKLARDRTSLQYNNFLTLAGIPPAVFDYKLGNRCALEWVIDRYRVTTDKRSGIVNDPNAYADDPRYIVELIGKVVTVSVETVAIVAGLPGLGV